MGENPIGLASDPTTPPAINSSPQAPPPPSDDTLLRRGLSHATSVITNHIMDISLSPINEEAVSVSASEGQICSENDENPFIFTSNGRIRDDESPPITMVAPVTKETPITKATSPVTVTPTTEIIITDVEEEINVPSNEQGSNDHRGIITGDGCGGRERATQATEKKQPHTYHRSSVKGVPPRLFAKRHSVHELGHPGLSPFSRQSSWNEYKGHSPPLHRRYGCEEGLNRYPSSPTHNTIFDGSLEEVAKLLRKMAEAIEKDMTS